MTTPVKGVPLATLIHDATQCPELARHGLVSSEAVQYVSSKVHDQYLAWCKAQPGWHAFSGESCHQRRKIRNRELAKRARMTQKQRFAQLEASHAQLEVENEVLRLQLTRLQSAAVDADFADPFAGQAVQTETGEFITFLPAETACQ